MKRLVAWVSVGVLLISAVAIGVLWWGATRPLPQPDNVAANALAGRLAAAWPDAAAVAEPGLRFSVTDAAGNLLAARGLSVGSDLEAVRERASALPIVRDGVRVGTLYVADPAATALTQRAADLARLATATVALVAAASLATLAWSYRRLARPFGRLRSFATDVAAGNLDAPLAQDRHDAFGPFTQAFDVMRTELARARAAEADARESKRALVAELGHDIATPIAAIAAASEVLALTETDPNRRAKIEGIQARAEQVSGLVTDLFQANDDELRHLGVAVAEVSSHEVAGAIRTTARDVELLPFTLPDALVSVDLRRWSQVVDNVLANAAKYAHTPVEVAGTIEGEFLAVTLRDRGVGVRDDELDAVLARGVRGSNAGTTPGLGLGLFIARQLMQRMGGSCELSDAHPGLAVTLRLPLAR